jgi:hypothetical protein|tara:strand:- start:2404 stop:3273 length:870 start_codon:yes stop_codon:yes gene_type:complete
MATKENEKEEVFDKGSNVDLEVYSLKADDDKPTYIRPIPDPLPGSDGECFVFTLIGPRSSGKSVVISNLVLRDEFMRGLFEEIIIISPTIHSDSTARFLINEVGKDKVYEAYSEQIIQDLIDSVKDKDRHEREMKLIILDDVIGSIPKFNSLVYNLTSKARHWSISMIISSQNLRELPPVCRNNTTHWAFFRSGNLKEIGKMMEEMGSLGSPDNCYSLYCTCVEEPHKFMYIDNKFNVHRCFSEHIWSKYTEDGHYNTDFVGADSAKSGMIASQSIEDPTKNQKKNVDN